MAELVEKHGRKKDEFDLDDLEDLGLSDDFEESEDDDEQH